MRHLLLASLLIACGGASTTSSPLTETTSGGDCPARSELAAAEQTLGECRARNAADPGWPARGAFDALMPRLAAHLASLEPARVVTADEVQPLAEEIWELLDQADLPAGAATLRSRAEDAAEHLLRDRDVRTAPAAAIEALEAVTQIAAVADPAGGVAPCATETAHAADARERESRCAPSSGAGH